MVYSLSVAMCFEDFDILLALFKRVGPERIEYTTCQIIGQFHGSLAGELVMVLEIDPEILMDKLIYNNQ